MFSARANTCHFRLWCTHLELSSRRALSSACKTKLEALARDLKMLRETEPYMHAVVFTQHQRTRGLVVEVARRQGITVYEIHGGVAMKTVRDCACDARDLFVATSKQALTFLFFTTTSSHCYPPPCNSGTTTCASFKRRSRWPSYWLPRLGLAALA